MTIKVKKVLFANTMVLLLTIFDQYTKARMTEIKNITFTDYFSFTYAENTGIAFGIPVPLYLLILLTILLIAAFLYFSIKELNINSYLTLTAVSLVVAGGVGNFLDRVLYGYVIDFIRIWNYPTFNFADIIILVGVLMIIAFYGRMKGTKIKNKDD